MSHSEQDLFLDNVGLIVRHAIKKYVNPVVDYDDFFQAGSIALLRAIRSFDKSRGVKFGTYAWKIVQNAIQHEAQKFNRRNVQLDDIITVDQHESLWEFLPESLSQQEKQVIELRFEGYTLTEVGSAMGFSKEWVRQVELSAREKIRNGNT